MPPMPRMPSTLPSGSWPSAGGGLPRQAPLRRASIEELKLRRAPRRRKSAVSAVAALTAVGTCEMEMPAAVQSEVESWS